MSKKIIAFSIEIEGKKNITDLTKLFALLEKQLIGVNKQLDELNKSTKSVSGKGLKDTEKQLQKTGTSAKRLTASLTDSFKQFQQGNKIVQDLGNGYFEVTREVDKATKEINENSESISALIKRNKDLKKALQDTEKGVESINFKGQTVSIKELTKEYARNNDAIKTFRKELRTGTKETDIQKGSILDLRKRVSALKKEYLALTPNQRKFTLQGIKTRRELIKLTKQLKKQEEQIGDFRRSVGNYARSLDKVGRSALKVFGIRGAFEGLRRVGQGLTNLVKTGAKTNETFNKIQTAASGLSNVATNLGTSILNTFGSGIQKTIESVSFVVFKVSEAFKSLANRGGIVGSIFSTIGTLIQDFPSVLGGVGAVFGEFFAKIGRGFDNASLRAQQLFLNVRRVASAITGEDVAAIDKQLNNITNRLKENAAAAVSFTDAFNRGFNEVQEQQKEFIRLNNEETEARKKNEEARKQAEEARKQAEEAEAERLKQLTADREALRQSLINEEAARLEIIKQLGRAVIDAEIKNEEDRTEAAIKAENERFKRLKEARNANFDEVLNDIVQQEAKISALFGDRSLQLAEFQKKSGEDLRKIQELNNQLSEQQEKEHRENLQQIRDEAARKQLEEQKALFDELEAEAAELEAEEAAAAARFDEIIKKQIEQTKANAQKVKESLKSILGTFFDAVNLALEASAAAEAERFDRAIEESDKRIENLNEELSNASGLQKKFLEQQIKQEEAAQEETNKNAERQRKEAAEEQKAVAIVQAVINTALAVSSALSTQPFVPVGVAAAVAAAAAGAVQIAAIAAQKFAKGGILAAEGGIINGPSHAEGGVPFTIGGRSGFEAEGGEAIINKRSTKLFRPLLSQINQAGGGVSFQTGGVLGPPIGAPAAAPVTNQTQSNFETVVAAVNSQTEAINNRIDRIQVINSVDSFNEVAEQDATLDAESTL